MITVLDAVTEYIHTEFASDLEVSELTTLDEDIGFDSLDVLELSMFLEERFDIMIDDLDIDACSTMTTIGDLVGAIRFKYDLE